MTVSPTNIPIQVDAALARLTQLYPKLIDLSLGRTYRLLGDLGKAGIRFRDIETRQSSLEDIFVTLVSERA